MEEGLRRDALCHGNRNAPQSHQDGVDEVKFKVKCCLLMLVPATWNSEFLPPFLMQCSSSDVVFEDMLYLQTEHSK
jgi:hypothetical protein